MNVFSAGQDFGYVTIFNVFEKSFWAKKSSSLYLFDQRYRQKCVLLCIIIIITI